MSRAAEPAGVVNGAARISPGQKVALVGEVIVAYGRARRALSRSDLPTALGELRAGSEGAGVQFSEADHVAGKQLGGAVRQTLALLPKRSRCLMQSLTLTTMLARRGIDSSLVIGVRSEDEFAAHAWVEYRGRPLLPTVKRRFERLTEV